MIVGFQSPTCLYGTKSSAGSLKNIERILGRAYLASEAPNPFKESISLCASKLKRPFGTYGQMRTTFS